jgi:hypothetical protein
MPSDAKTIRKLWALNDENVRLRKELAERDATIAKWQECGDRIMEALFGKAAPLSDSDVIALFRQREENWERAIKGLAEFAGKNLKQSS